MNKIDKVLLDSVKNMQGSVLGFGNISQKIIDSIDKNNNILEFTLLSGDSGIKVEKDGFSSKKIPYHKIYKKFRKKNITSIIASYDELAKYKRRFISDSLCLAKQNVIVFIKNEDIDVDVIKKRYDRYHQNCEIINCRDGVVFIITKEKYKKNKLRDKLYLFINCIEDVINFIGDLFVI